MAENITVQELGEDGDLWLVTGTTDAHSADEAVRQWVEATTGETIEALHDADDLIEFRLTRRTDWAWRPGLNPDDPMEDATLLHGGPTKTGILPTFSGFLVQA